MRAALAPLIPGFTAVARALEPYRIGFWMIAEPVLAPILVPLCNLRRCTITPLLARAALLRQRISLDWTLWRAYRREFRGSFASFREFKRAFNARMSSSANGSQRSGPPPPPRDPFAAACEVMGLPAHGNFTEAEFKARYRALMKQFHPDIAGPNKRAAEVNAASMQIRKRKGWS